MSSLQVTSTSVVLVERDSQLTALRSWLDEAAGGAGRVVFVGGEAGAGKSALVTDFCQSLGTGVPVYLGACEPLSVARPLGPISDMAPKLGGRISELLRCGDRSGVFAATLEELSLGRTLRVMVIEDAHWADESTFDFLQFLARRIAAAHVLVVVTFRDDHSDRTSPMSMLLGDLASLAPVRRLSIPSLTLSGVRSLAAATPLDAEKLHRDTGGNAFFVTEVLRQGSYAIPVSVADAVMARIARLPRTARDAIEVAAVVGGKVQPAMICELAGTGASELDECATTGFLLSDGPYLVFRHELARQAVLGAIPPMRRAQMHAKVLDRLRAVASDPGNLARLAEHAEEAGDASAVLEFAPSAAAAAIALGSHREAAFQYRRALRFAVALGAREQAELLERLAIECYLIDERAEAIDAWREAIRLWERLGDTLRLGDGLRQLADGFIHSGGRAESELAANRAVEVLEPLGPSAELAMAYAEQGRLSMLAEDSAATIEWGEKTLKVAAPLGHVRALARVDNFLGVVTARGGDPDGEALLKRGLELATDAGLEDEATWAYINLACIAFERLDLGAMARFYEAGLAYCDEHDLYSAALGMQAGLGEARFWSGRWGEAVELCRPALATPRVSRVSALVVLARVRSRRRDPDVWPLLDEALDLAVQADELQFLGLVAAARAEARWLGGQDNQVATEVREAFELALNVKSPWFIGELGWWLWRVGALPTAPPGAPGPFALQIKGDWKAASSQWDAHGFPYEAAMALVDSPQEADVRAAVETFDRLGATASREFALRRLRQLGATSIPRGQRSSTRSNPGGLTSREIEVLRLLEHGMSDPEIAKAMFLSPRTVSHHVSAILAKLEVTSRREAARVARQIPLVRCP